MFNKDTKFIEGWRIGIATKMRMKCYLEKLKRDMGKILRELCERKGLEIIAAECCPDHIHMMIRIPPKYSVP